MAAPRVLLPGWDLQRVLVSEPEGQQKVLLTGQDASPILLQGQNGKPQILAGQDGQTVVLPGQEAAKLLLANRNYQKLVLPTAQNMAASAHQRQEAQVVRVVVAPDGQKLLLPAQKEVQQSGASVVLDSQEGQKVANGQTFLLRGQDSQQVIVLRSNERVNSTASVGMLFLPIPHLLALTHSLTHSRCVLCLPQAPRGADLQRRVNRPGNCLVSQHRRQLLMHPWC